MTDMVPWVGWLAHLDTPTSDGRVLRDVTVGRLPLPVLTDRDVPRLVGTVNDMWVEDDYLCGSGKIEQGALSGRTAHPVGFDVVDVVTETVFDQPDPVTVIRSGRLLGIYLTDQPPWPDARLEVTDA